MSSPAESAAPFPSSPPIPAEALRERTIGRPQDALASADRAVALDPNAADAHLNRGTALQDLGRLEEALASYDRAVALDPTDPAAHSHRGSALEQLGRHDEALASFDRSIALDPTNAEACFNKGLCLLRLGRFEEGWPLYEWRKARKQPVAVRVLPQPLWLGDRAIGGKSLFIHSEQGPADTIQFCRYARLAEHRGARVVLGAPLELHRLLRSLSPTIQIIGETEIAREADYHCPLLSLPAAFKTTIETIPAAVPYLEAQTERVNYWRQRIGRHGFKVGICWQRDSGRAEIGRSFPLALFRRISRIPGVRLISLQKGPGCAQLLRRPPDLSVEVLGEDFDAGPDAFLDMAAVMESLDLIVSSDTAVAHVAGALARPTWVALKHVAEWRWMLDRSDSPWYPSLRLFRQSRAGDWEGVFAEMYEELRAAAATAAREIDAASGRARQARESNPAAEWSSTPQSNPAQWWLQRGNALLALQRHQGALESYDRALALQPDASTLLNARGIALEGLGRGGEAADCYRRAIALKPGYAKAYSNLGRLLRNSGDLKGAIECFRTAVAIQPNLAMAQHNLEECEYDLAVAFLKKGNFAAGWFAFESGLGARLRARAEAPSGLERWDGCELANRTLVVVAEESSGDTIHFCRYGALLNARGIRPVLQVDPRLAQLLGSTGYFSGIVAPGAPLSAAEHVWCPLLSLPLVFRTDMASIPAFESYLRAAPARVAQWRERLGPLEGLKVGIAWQDNPTTEIASLRGRSMRATELAPLATTQGVTLISLQKGAGREQIGQLPFRHRVIDWADELDCGSDAFLDTAALMANLDLVITVDTSIAHLAGALGRPVWVALHQSSDWRWFEARSDSPWYPSMHLFRQSPTGGWQPVVSLMREQLERTIRDRPTPRG